jgi:hypothetical protein
LARLTDEQIEQKVLCGRSGFTHFRVAPEDVSNRIRKKCKIQYSADAAVDLVIHEGSTPIDGLWACYAVKHLVNLITEEITGSKFTRVWLVDFSGGKFLVVENQRAV